MANAIGAGFVTLPPVRDASAPLYAKPAPLPPPPPDPDTIEALAILERAVWVLGSAPLGLTAKELKDLLDEPIARVQRALAEGLRARRLRRLGARRNVRYVLNA